MRYVPFLAFALLAAFPAAADQAQLDRGRAIYAEYCALCHGADGRRGQGFQTPIWGPQTQIPKFQNALGLFEYNEVLMPFDGPDKIDEAAKWAVTLYLLVNHGAMRAGQTLSRANAAQIPIR
ncbi:MAG: c-type cytochrome [Tagaea sp.]|nr:c-type cytochrome [Tagaea sp.]